jgi:hypothetical protein
MTEHHDLPSSFLLRPNAPGKTAYYTWGDQGPKAAARCRFGMPAGGFGTEINKRTRI